MIRSAFTLVELLVVIAIVGMLSSIAVTQMSVSREKARIAKGLEYDGGVFRSVGDDIVGQWDFDDCSGTTASDSSGNGNSGGLIGTAAWSTDTPSGQECSISFDGSARVSIPYADMGTQMLTYSLWFNTPSSATMNIFSFRSTLIRVDANGIYWWPNVQVARTTFSKNITLNNWHQLVVDQNGTAVTAYLDGGLLGNGVGLAINNTNISNFIGYYTNSGTSYSGLVDNVRLYHRSLTAQEVYNLYAEESAKNLAALVK